MKFFYKDPKFILVECRKCGGPLELDTNYETAHCTICGMQYLVQNVDKKKRIKRTRFEMVMDYVEKERDLKRRDNLEKTKIKQEKEVIEQKRVSRILLIYGIIFILMMVTGIILSSLCIIE
jgi:DNA-directed RNA polymerase subunit RPC12/RpoP